jgi:hypothetical protein
MSEFPLSRASKASKLGYWLRKKEFPKSTENEENEGQAVEPFREMHLFC